MDSRKALGRILDSSFSQIVLNCAHYSPAEWLAHAEEFALLKFMVNTIPSTVSDEDVIFLLQLDTPLTTMAKQWAEENSYGVSHADDIHHCITSLREAQEQTQEPPDGPEEAPGVTMC